MPVYERGPSTDFEVVDTWADGLGWLAHPDEEGQRVSHAIRAEDGVWLFDPLDAPGIDDRLADLGPVAGVVVCSDWHARDADIFARRYDVAIHAPCWLSRVESVVAAAVEDFEDGMAGFDVHRLRPLPGWQEALLYRESDGTLYSPDVLSRQNAVGEEQVGLTLPTRPFPPRDLLGNLEPDRILSGHGRGVTTDASSALELALDAARANLPRAVLSQAGPMTRGVLAAVRT